MADSPQPRDSLLETPQPPFAANGSETPRGSALYSMNSSTAGSGAQLNEKSNVTSAYPMTAQLSGRKRLWTIVLISLGVLAVLVVAIIVPVYYKVIKPNNNASNLASSGGDSNGSGGSSDQGNPSSPTGAVTGGDGSEVLLEDGSKFTYRNSFGGFWVSDPKNPYNNSARPNSWTPALNEKWDWTKDRVYGVNVGGWLVIEPFISPALFQKYPKAVDEWTLSEMMTADTKSGGLQQLEEHYKTFITEEDFARIAAAGLNWVRLPIPYWAVEAWPGEPFLAKTSWTYLLKAIGWARKYGLRVNLDLHTIPGSQNGYNHSGKLGSINFLHGPMGYANAQRALEYVRIITEFFSQPEYKDVVQMFSIMNEARVADIGKDVITEYYHQAHNMIRNITGIGEGFYIGIHDGFQGVSNWGGFLSGSDRIVLDTHPYFSFGGSSAMEPIGVDGKGGQWPHQACAAWGPNINKTKESFGITIGGEFSAGYNDCGLFLIGPQTDQHSYGGDCEFWEDARQWNQTTKDGVKAFAMASMDAIGHFFFWTWKIGNSSVSGVPSSPLWSYSHGLDMGYMPTDPREAEGMCDSLGVSETFDNTYKPWQTGGAGAGEIKEELNWPPQSMSGAAVPFASYTPTGSIVSVPEPTHSGATTTASGWANPQDTAGAPTPISGCTYPNAWTAASASPDFSWNCGAAAKRSIPEPTAPPSLRFKRS